MAREHAHANSGRRIAFIDKFIIISALASCRAV
jgi:hypothetical protein